MRELKVVAMMLRLNIEQVRLPEILEKAALTAVLQEAFLPLAGGAFLSCVPDSFPLVESDADQQRRRVLDRRLSNLQHAHNVISNIEQQVDAVSTNNS